MSRASRRARRTSAISKSREDALAHNNKTSGKEFTPITNHKRDYVEKLLKQSRG